MRTGWRHGAWLAALVSSLATGAQAAPDPDAPLARLVEVDRQLRLRPRTPLARMQTGTRAHPTRAAPSAACAICACTA